MQIFLARNNVQAGPYSLDQLNIMLTSGEVRLNDLVWHDGLDKWQSIGDLTHNQYVYRPTTPAPNHPPVNDSIINNVTVFPEDSATSTQGKKSQDGKKLSVDRLYGKPESKSTIKPDMTTNRQHAPSNVSLNKSAKAVSANDALVGDIVIAPIMSRILATAINALLALLAILPFLLALTRTDIDLTKIQDSQDLSAILEYTKSIIETIPSSTLLTSQAMIFGLMIIQLVFITSRGQSLGKLITGIRVVDQTTHRLPSFITLIGTRTLLLFVFYYFLFTFTSFFGLIFIAVYYYFASKSPENIGWHDKLAKTLVVKANDSQLNKKIK